MCIRDSLGKGQNKNSFVLALHIAGLQYKELHEWTFSKIKAGRFCIIQCINDEI